MKTTDCTYPYLIWGNLLALNLMVGVSFLWYRWKHGRHCWILSAPMGNLSWNSCTKFRCNAMRMLSSWSCSLRLWGLSMNRMYWQKTPFFTGSAKEQTPRAGMQVHCISSIRILSVRLGRNYKLKLFHYSAYFCYHSWTSLNFLTLFMGLIILVQLIFTFIYTIFNKNFLVWAK